MIFGIRISKQTKQHDISITYKYFYVFFLLINQSSISISLMNMSNRPSVGSYSKAWMEVIVVIKVMDGGNDGGDGGNGCVSNLSKYIFNVGLL